MKILLVDDDPGILEVMSKMLAHRGHHVQTCPTPFGVSASIVRDPPDVVVLDVMMPGLNGVKVVQRLREDGITVPVCMLSARDEVDDRVAGLAAGADDYVVKPFSITELAARLHALVRLHATTDQRPLAWGDLAIDSRRRIATRAGRDLRLTTREFDLLLTLVQHAGQVLSRNQLLARVWGYTWEVDSNVVDVFVGYLRRKLEADGAPRILQTVRGVGFVVGARR